MAPSEGGEVALIILNLDENLRHLLQTAPFMVRIVGGLLPCFSMYELKFGTLTLKVPHFQHQFVFFLLYFSLII